MRVLTALKWTSNLNKSLVKMTAIENNCRISSIVNRAIHCQNNESYLPALANNININARKNSTVRCNQSPRSFSITNSLAKGKDREKKKKPGKVQVNVNELSEHVNIDNVNAQFEKAIEELKNNFVKHLTLRSSTGSIEQVSVTFEGQDYLLQELVDISRKPKTVVLNVNVFPQAIPQILDALSKSGMNLNPQQDGTTIFIPIPKVTKEHRENLSKNAKALYIRCRDNIKDIRNNEVRTLKKKASVSEDTIRRLQSQLEALGDQYITKAEQVLEAKQKDLLGSSD